MNWLPCLFMSEHLLSTYQAPRPFPYYSTRSSQQPSAEGIFVFLTLHLLELCPSCKSATVLTNPGSPSRNLIRWAARRPVWEENSFCAFWGPGPLSQMRVICPAHQCEFQKVVDSKQEVYLFVCFGGSLGGGCFALFWAIVGEVNTCFSHSQSIPTLFQTGPRTLLCRHWLKH